MEYNQTNTGAGGRVTQGSGGRDLNEYSSMSDSVLEGMNSPTYTDRVVGRNQDNTVGGYKNTGFRNDSPTDESSNNFGYGSSISGGGITASSVYWTLPVRDRIFLSREFVPNNTNDVKRLQHILGRNPTGIMDLFTKQKYRAMMGMAQNNNDPNDYDIYGYAGSKNHNVAQIRAEKEIIDQKQTELAWKNMHAKGYRKGPPGTYGRHYNTNILREKVAWAAAWQKYRNSKLNNVSDDPFSSNELEESTIQEETVEPENTISDTGMNALEENNNNAQIQTQSMLEIALSQIQGMDDWDFGW